MGRRRAYTDEQLVDAVQACRTYAQVLARLGLVAAGGNYATMHACVRRLGLDTSHMRGQGWARGSSGSPRTPPLPLGSVLTEHSTYQSYKLKQRLLAAGLLKAECARCGNAHWLGGRIPLELDHINGIRTDNRLENLRVLCPNCHALAPSYRAKNTGKRQSAGVVEWHTRSS